MAARSVPCATGGVPYATGGVAYAGIDPKPASRRPALKIWPPQAEPGRHVPHTTYPPDPLFPRNWLCYNLRAVERVAKDGAASVFPDARRVNPEPSASVSMESPGSEGSQAAETVNPQQDSAPHEDPSRFCPVCSQRLTSRRCKLICTVCAYYMSCADYY